MLALRQFGAKVLLRVTGQARGSLNAVAGLHANALKLLLTAPPFAGQETVSGPLLMGDGVDA